MTKTDGRNSRRARSREKIMAAVKARLFFGNFRPTIPEIAKDARVSVRTVFEIYKNHEGLISEAIKDQATYDRLLCILFDSEVPPWTIGSQTAKRVLEAALFGRIIEGTSQNA